jgi:hypothetical protein
VERVKRITAVFRVPRLFEKEVNSLTHRRENGPGNPEYLKRLNGRFFFAHKTKQDLFTHLPARTPCEAIIPSKSFLEKMRVIVQAS